MRRKTRQGKPEAGARERHGSRAQAVANDRLGDGPRRKRVFLLDGRPRGAAPRAARDFGRPRRRTEEDEIGAQ